jgi:hypothetical protein
MSPRERGNYVRAHLENKIQENHETIGPVGTRDLNKKVATSTYFLSNLHELFLPDNMEHQRTIRELKRFLLDISNEPDDPVGELPVPVYSRKVLSEAVKSASTGFRQRWLGYLGIESHPNFPKAVWATVKALTRRLAEGWADEHAHLAPIAQFRTEIETSLFRALSSPIRWTTNNASQDERDQVIRGIAAQLGPELRELANHRIAATKRGAWYDAYSQAGTGSAKIRASIIKNDIIDQSSPESSSNQSMDLVNMILKIFEDLGRKGLLFLLD